MTERVFAIEGENFDDFASFIREFNRVFTSELNAHWNGNLDAFNDYLSWPNEKYILVWKNSNLSAQGLGHLELVKWLEERVSNCHPLNEPEMQLKLEAAERREGPTLFDWVVEIIRDNAEFVELHLK